MRRAVTRMRKELLELARIDEAETVPDVVELNWELENAMRFFATGPT